MPFLPAADLDTAITDAIIGAHSMIVTWGRDNLYLMIGGTVLWAHTQTTSGKGRPRIGLETQSPTR